MNLETIGTVIGAIALLATGVSTFLSRREQQTRKDLAHVLRERESLRTELLAADARNFTLQRLLASHGIGIPDESTDLPARRRHARRDEGGDPGDDARDA